MDALNLLLDRLKRDKRLAGHFLGLLHVLIGRRITAEDGTVVSTGLAWRTLAGWLKKVRWNPDAVKELGLDPAGLSPRDRQQFWFQAMTRSNIDSEEAANQGDQIVEIFHSLGYEVGPRPGR